MFDFSSREMKVSHVSSKTHGDRFSIVMGRSYTLSHFHINKLTDAPDWLVTVIDGVGVGWRESKI